MLWCGGILVLLATALAFPPEWVTSDAEWDLWKTTHGKQYSSWEEEKLRRSFWKKNMLIIEAHNLEYNMGQHSYYLGMNHLGDMTTEEVIEKMTCLTAPQNEATNNTLAVSEFPTRLPRSLDYRQKGWVTPVRNQRSCESCWAFSATGALEGQLMKSRGKLVELSPQNLVDCSSNYGNKGCKGGHMLNAYEYMKDIGIDSEKTYPYVAKERNCTFSNLTKVAKIWDYKVVPQGNEKALKEIVVRYGPVAAAIQSGLKSFQFYGGGIYSDRRCGKGNVDHAALVVGYGVCNKCGQFWIVKNSWGSAWGEKGYIRIARNRKNLCKIASQASIPLL